MRMAALTHVYNEVVNLPIWVRHYGRVFGPENLFVLDHGSDDGSTSGLGAVNVIRVPRTPFDDVAKSQAIGAFQRMLIQYYEAVVVTDCDEMLVADPARHADLGAFIAATRPPMMAGLSVQLHHRLDCELPIDLDKPILSQRRFAMFFGMMGCKPALSCTAANWRPGQHVSDVRPEFHADLYLFHLKFMDYGCAVRRHAVNAGNVWSQAQTDAGIGLHHRYDGARFVAEGFLGPTDAAQRGLAQPFEFEAEIAAMRDGMREIDGYFFPGEATPKYVEIPERFAGAF